MECIIIPGGILVCGVLLVLYAVGDRMIDGPVNNPNTGLDAVMMSPQALPVLIFAFIGFVVLFAVLYVKEKSRQSWEKDVSGAAITEYVKTHGHYSRENHNAALEEYKQKHGR